MAIDIVRGAIKNQIASADLIETINGVQNEYTGTLFLAYPLSATAESVVTIDALLVTKEKGIIAFIFDSGAEREEQQDSLYYQITNTLNNYETLRKGRRLAVEPNVITYCVEFEVPECSNEYIYASRDNMKEILENSIGNFDSDYYEKLIEALQKISTMKPKKQRRNVVKESSRGAIMKNIEKQIANLDQWQKKAAFEVPEGPQRIRGLAGSGKTVVLALKAAYLHAQYPDWNIAVTYYTRSLSQQFSEMIANFSREFIGDEPDWNRLHIIHAWGTYSEEGIYSIAVRKVGLTPLNYTNAKSKYGSNGAFEGICREAVCAFGNQTYEEYDAILIDEAQDMPSDFFKLCYSLLKEPKRLVFAYDELQNLGNNSMPSLEEMFGLNMDGTPKVVLENKVNEARQDIVLPICYRNTPWALTLAHSLGFGIYRPEGLVQLFSDTDLWTDIGYKVISGTLENGKHVKLMRSEEASPTYFKDLLDKDDAVLVERFDNRIQEYKWVSEQIKKNIEEDELDPDDILVIFPDTYYAKSEYAEFRKFLILNGINSNLVGVATSRDTFKTEGCITCSHIYRAKGNEAPMVYILNADYCAQNIELRKVRNILFTAITRSRAWVRICGVGDGIDILLNETKHCTDKGYALEFKIPTEAELKKMNLIHRDRTEQEIREMKNASKMAKDLSRLIKEGKIDVFAMPELTELFQNIDDRRDVYDEDEY